MKLLETGGCWVWRFGRSVDWSRGASLARDMVDAVEDILVCLFAALGLLNTAPPRVCPDCACCCSGCWLWCTGARAAPAVRYELDPSTMVDLFGP